MDIVFGYGCMMGLDTYIKHESIPPLSEFSLLHLSVVSPIPLITKPTSSNTKQNNQSKNVQQPPPRRRIRNISFLGVRPARCYFLKFNPRCAVESIGFYSA